MRESRLRLHDKRGESTGQTLDLRFEVGKSPRRVTEFGPLSQLFQAMSGRGGSAARQAANGSFECVRSRAKRDSVTLLDRLSDLFELNGGVVQKQADYLRQDSLVPIHPIKCRLTVEQIAVNRLGFTERLNRCRRLQSDLPARRVAVAFNRKASR
jgi:hypothetical protein